MMKQEFLDELKEELRNAPFSVANTYLENYSELIDDLIENGQTEAEAVASMGTPADIVSGLSPTETPPKKKGAQKNQVTAVALVLSSLLTLLIMLFFNVYNWDSNSFGKHLFHVAYIIFLGGILWLVLQLIPFFKRASSLTITLSGFLVSNIYFLTESHLPFLAPLIMYRGVFVFDLICFFWGVFELIKTLRHKKT